LHQAAELLLKAALVLARPGKIENREKFGIRQFLHLLARQVQSSITREFAEQIFPA
jgi:hypothetical protein